MIEGTGSHISHRHQKMSKQCRITSSDYKKGIRDDNFSTCLLKKKSFDHGLIYFLKLLWNINPPIDNFPVQCQPRQIQKTFRIFSYPAQLFVDYAMVYAYMGQHYTQVPNNNFLVQYWYNRSRQHGIYSQLQGSCKKRLCGLLGQHYCMHTSIYLIFCAILSLTYLGNIDQIDDLPMLSPNMIPACFCRPRLFSFICIIKVVLQCKFSQHFMGSSHFVMVY